MNFFVFIGLAILGFCITTIITNQIGISQKEYIGIKYSSFEFSNDEKRPYGLNVLIRILFPVMYVIICSGIFYEIDKKEFIENIYMITVFYYIIRTLFIIIILGRKDLHNWKSEIITSIIGTIITWGLYKVFITQTTEIFISLEELRDGIWIAIITFAFVLCKEYLYNNIFINTEKERDRKENYIFKKYEKFRDKYWEILNEENDEIANLVYAIMIYENYNRPPIIRFFENFKCLLGKETTLGVMQVKSKAIIRDKTSVKLGYNIVNKAYKKNIKEEKSCLNGSAIEQTIFDYNNSYDYVEEVMYIYSEIMWKYFNNENEDAEI